MAKRGETRPWRLRYEWDNGVKGTSTHATEEDARWHAEQMTQRGANPDAGAVRTTIERR